MLSQQQSHTLMPVIQTLPAVIYSPGSSLISLVSLLDSVNCSPLLNRLKGTSRFWLKAWRILVGTPFSASPSSEFTTTRSHHQKEERTKCLGASGGCDPMRFNQHSSCARDHVTYASDPRERLFSVRSVHYPPTVYGDRQEIVPSGFVGCNCVRGSR